MSIGINEIAHLLRGPIASSTIDSKPLLTESILIGDCCRNRLQIEDANESCMPSSSSTSLAPNILTQISVLKYERLSQFISQGQDIIYTTSSGKKAWGDSNGHGRFTDCFVKLIQSPESVGLGKLSIIPSLSKMMSEAQMRSDFKECEQVMEYYGKPSSDFIFRPRLCVRETTMRFVSAARERHSMFQMEHVLDYFKQHPGAMFSGESTAVDVVFCVYVSHQL